MSEKISTESQRHIVYDFAEEINSKKDYAGKPEYAVIEFRNDRQNQIERQIVRVPIKLLRFRKDNGRIASDVKSYETTNGVLNETTAKTQEVLRGFLAAKDTEQNTKLLKSIEHSGQNEPAIITCDGFLINGNRRKMTIEALLETKKDPKYETMRVVILPGKNDAGGPPTLKEIEQIENRYQLQSDGKSEYTNFDRAISIQRKIRAGMSLDEQLKDDPSLVGLTAKEFKKEMQKIQDEFLGPLECIDRYLEHLGRENLYDNISEGRSDREGRWYSFIDYYKSVYKPLKDEKTRTKDFAIEEDEVGKIEDIAFKIIRKKDDLGHKTHEVIRKIPKILKNKNAKKEFMKILDVSNDLAPNEYNETDELKIIDKKWGTKNATIIIGRIKEAIKILDEKTVRETPITLLEGALKKLKHENMEPRTIDRSKLAEAMRLTRKIADAASDLEDEFYAIKKRLDKVAPKK